MTQEDDLQGRLPSSLEGEVEVTRTRSDCLTRVCVPRSRGSVVKAFLLEEFEIFQTFFAERL